MNTEPLAHEPLSRPPLALSGIKEIVRPYYLKWLYFNLKGSNCPPHFKDCWKYPISTPESSALNLPSDGTQNDFVFLPMADWHTCTQRSQHFATSLATLGHRCVYINPHLGREFSNTYLRSPKVVVGSLAPRVRELHVHLPREPVFHQRCLTLKENRILVAAVDRLLRAMNSSRPVLIVSFPLWESLSIELKQRYGCRIIYDCHDLLAGFGNISDDILAAEDSLLTSCDLAVFSAEWLRDHTLARRPHVGAKVALIRNAVDYNDFQAAAAGGQRPDHVSKTIGYVGALNFWFDTDSVRLAATTHPGWTFVLIGLVENGKLDALRDLLNVQFVGKIPYNELPLHLSKFDVAIIPFLKSPLTFATNPIKLYEYFACGLPVVSTRLPEVESFGDLVYLADDPESFVEQLEKAVGEECLSRRTRRIELAKRESWLSRCNQLKRNLDSLDEFGTDKVRLGRDVILRTGY